LNGHDRSAGGLGVDCFRASFAKLSDDFGM
jgi:hypothetical protein